MWPFPLLPAAPPLAAPSGSSPLVMLGVGQMLFFAPMLVSVVAQQVLPHGGSLRTLLVGSAAGVTAGAALSALWAFAVYRAVGVAGLAGSSGTAVTALAAAAPAKPRWPCCWDFCSWA